MRLYLLSVLALCAFVMAGVLSACKNSPLAGFSKTKTGLLYKINKSRTAKAGAKLNEGDELTFNAYIRHGDTVLQSTIQQGGPITQPLVADPKNKFVEALLLGTVGDSMTIAIPVDSMPGGPQKPFHKGEYIFYDFVLLSARSKTDVAKETAREPELHAALDARLAEYKSGKLTTQKTESGLKYVIHEQGNGKPAENGKTVSVHYIGVLPDGTEFDNSIKRGQPIDFPLGAQRVIKGWDEGVALLKEGGKATLFVPYQLAYGEAGRPPQIPAKAELVFYIELVSVK